MLPARQKGFTIIELLVTLFIIGIIISVGYAATSGSREDSRFAIAEVEIKKSFPEAIQKTLLRLTDCSGRTKAQLMARGLPTNNAYGNSWSVTATAARSITIQYPVRNSTDASEMATRVSGDPTLTSATASGSNLTLVYPCI